MGGRAVVAFRSNDPKRIRFRYMLKSFEEPTEDLRDCICFYKTGDLIYFLMKLPHEGKYTLEMYAKLSEPGRKKKKAGQKQKKKKGKDKKKDKKNAKETKGSSRRNQASDDDDDDDEESYESICNYLIKSDVGCYDLAPYPPLNNIYGQTGDVTELNDDDLCLVPQSHRGYSAIHPPLTDHTLTSSLTPFTDLLINPLMTAALTSLNSIMMTSVWRPSLTVVTWSLTPSFIFIPPRPLSLTLIDPS